MPVALGDGMFPSHVTHAFRPAILATIFLVTLASSAAAQSVTLAWNPNTESNLTGYVVEYGPQSGNPSSSMPVGNVTSQQITGLQAGVTYYFRVRAVNTAGQQSAPSNQVSYTPAGLPPPPPAPADDTDGDGLPNWWETQFGTNPASASGANGASGDPDGDGASNLTEYGQGAHPRGFHRRFFAEGAANGFFSTRLAIANPQTTQARVLLTFVDANGQPTQRFIQVAARSRYTVDTSLITELAGASFSTMLDSDQLIVLDRLMSWGGGYAAHAETSLSAAANRWFLAEGATHGAFDLFYLIQNPGATAADVQVRYLRPGGVAPVLKYYSIPARSRFTIWVDQEDAALAATDVSAEVISQNNVPIIVERSMYLNTPGQPFKGGHNSSGVTAPATSWFLAEGATGNFFSMFVLIANPSSQAAAVRATYLRDAGAPVVKTYTVPANSRFTVNVAFEDPELVSTATAVQVQSTNDVPIIVERTMWWPGASGAWTEGHNAFGTTSTGPRWLLAEGEEGGSRGTMTFVLVANTSTAAANVRVTLLFENGAEESSTLAVGAQSRSTVSIGSAFPNAAGRRFSVLVESLNPSAAGALVVERAIYSNTGADFWGVGSGAVATRLP
jgi:Fibronectin type III domain/Bacterial TSP3 repeat